jgi:hypothetical protein
VYICAKHVLAANSTKHHASFLSFIWLTPLIAALGVRSLHASSHPPQSGRAHITSGGDLFPFENLSVRVSPTLLPFSAIPHSLAPVYSPPQSEQFRGDLLGASVTPESFGRFVC